MEDEPEVIRQQMDDTRTALSDKLEALETKVAQPVNATIEAVTESVDAVKETVASVTGALQDSVQSLRDTFDLSKQFERRPWMMLGGAVLVGYLGGRLIGSPGRIAAGAASVASTAASAALPAMSAAMPAVKAAMTPSRSDEPSPLTETMQTLRGLAVGTILGLVRDMAAEHLPDGISKTVADSVDDLTTKLGGTKIEQILSHETEEPSEQAGQEKPRDMSSVAPTKGQGGKNRRGVQLSRN